jgi:hypothetical protein
VTNSSNTLVLQLVRLQVKLNVFFHILAFSKIKQNHILQIDSLYILVFILPPCCVLLKSIPTLQILGHIPIYFVNYQ